eukprot:TRINITY_DN6637_c0_g1_i4.p1 TRINITY_DN6637_c0_g1~~TRINITY_DN6637_c0_g1_i4.p1  ORF type:complete len:893 (+),score=276.77 TRINITY_DN6637_c0_g1_i4:307-2985(+)
MGSIEALAKQLEVYKAKSPFNSEKKPPSTESKETKKLKSENAHLNELVKFKDARLKELQHELTRLRLIVPVDTSLPDISTDPLHRRIEELAKTGKIELKLHLSHEDANGSAVDRVVSADAGGLTQRCIAQAKMMDEWIQQVEIAKREGLKTSLSSNSDFVKTMDEYKEKYVVANEKLGEITRQRNELERKVNGILAMENIVTNAFEELIQIMEDLLESSPSVKAVDLSARLDEIKGMYAAAKEPSKSPPKKAWRFPMPVQVVDSPEHTPDYNSFEDVHSGIKQLLSKNQVLQAANLWKQIDYGVPEKGDKGEWLELLQLTCKCRDSQLQTMEKQVSRGNVLKGCVELKNEEILELMTDYEDMKSKYIYVTTVTVKKMKESVKELQRRAEELQNEMDKKDIFFADKESENRLLKSTIEVMKKSIDNANLEKEVSNKKLQEKIDTLESKIKDSKQPDFNASETIKKECVKEDALTQDRFDIVLLENRQNRAIIAEMLNNKDKANPAKELYEEKIRLIDQMLESKKETEQLKVILKGIRVHQSSTMDILKKALKFFDQRVEDRSINADELIQMAEEELYKAGKISEVTEELQLFMGILRQSREGCMAIKEIAEFRKEFTRINKDYFIDERLSEVTTEMLIERLRRKNDLFKQLFGLYNKAIALTEVFTLENKRLCEILRANDIEIKDVALPNIKEQKTGSESDSTKYLNEKASYLEKRLLDANNYIDQLKDKINDKDKEVTQLKKSVNQLEDRSDKHDKTPRELDELLVKCTKLEDELAEARELHFNYEKQNEEISAQYNTIQALKAKTSRLEDLLDKKQEECKKLKEKVKDGYGEAYSKGQNDKLLEADLNELKEKIKEVYQVAKQTHIHKLYKDGFDDNYILEFLEVSYVPNK